MIQSEIDKALADGEEQGPPCDTNTADYYLQSCKTLAAAYRSLLAENGKLKAALSGRTVSCGNCEAMAKQRDGLAAALEAIANMGWTAYNGDGGPSDATPNEKGLLQYVGRAHERAKEALSTHTKPAHTEER